MSWVRLLQQDCRMSLKQIPDKSIDLILTDPPWAIGKKDYDKDKDLKLIAEIKQDLKRVLKDGGHLLLDISFVKIFDLHSILKEDFLFRQPIILYCNNQIGHRSYAGWNLFRMVMWYCKVRADGSPAPVVKKYRDVLEFPMRSNKAEGWKFPNPKDLESYKFLVKMFSKEGDTVLDCFLGSGTTALACKETNRNCIGIEMDADFFEIAKTRIGKLEGN